MKRVLLASFLFLLAEVSVAEEARVELEEIGIPTRLVSVPCLDILIKQNESFIDDIRGQSEVVIAIEAGVKAGWTKIIGANGHFIGMSDFGASAPSEMLFHHFGITSKAIINLARYELNQI